MSIAGAALAIQITSRLRFAFGCSREKNLDNGFHLPPSQTNHTSIGSTHYSGLCIGNTADRRCRWQWSRLLPPHRPVCQCQLSPLNLRAGGQMTVFLGWLLWGGEWAGEGGNPIKLSTTTPDSILKFNILKCLKIFTFPNIYLYYLAESLLNLVRLILPLFPSSKNSGEEHQEQNSRSWVFIKTKLWLVC